MHNSQIQVKLAKHKKEILQKQETWKEKQEERTARDHLFHEWERIRVIIRRLRKDMKSETDEDFKMDIQADIDSFLNRKKNLANMLNLIKKIIL